MRARAIRLRVRHHPDLRAEEVLLAITMVEPAPGAAPYLNDMLKDESVQVRTRAQLRLDDPTNQFDQRQNWGRRFQGR